MNTLQYCYKLILRFLIKTDRNLNIKQIKKVS